jgi:hypothetical protein
VNIERTKRGIPLLHRSVDLDELAKSVADLATRGVGLCAFPDDKLGGLVTLVF